MTARQRQDAIERALAELARRNAGYVLFVDAENGDNYLELTADRRAEATHRRWPASKLPPLGPRALQKLDSLGFREAERNLSSSWEGWSIARMARQVEAVFTEAYGCRPDFDLKVTVEGRSPGAPPAGG